LIFFLWSKLFFPSPIDLHSPIWFPRLAGPSSFRLLHDFGIYSVSLHCSVQSSLGSARSLYDCVGSLSDRHLAQPGLSPIMSGLCPIIIWLSLVSVRSCRASVRSSFGSAGSLPDHHFAQLLSYVVCRWPDSFCDLLFGLSFVIDLSRGLPSTIPGFRCGS
jgi:hypothetical protein